MLAHVELDGGTTVDFLDLDAGFVAISAEYPADATDPLLEFRASDMTVLELYEALTGQAAPEALERAAERAAEMAEPEPDGDEGTSEGEGDGDGDGDGPHSGEITGYHSASEAQKFEDLYCGSYTQYCRLHITEWAQRTTDTTVKQAGAIVRPYSGNIGLQLLFYKNGWRNINNVTVQEGNVRQLTYANWEQGTGPFYARHKVRMIIHDAVGDGFDYAFWAYSGSGIKGTAIPPWD